MKKKIFLFDVLPGALFEQEITGYLAPDITLVVNMPPDHARQYIPCRHGDIEQVHIDTRDEQQVFSVAKRFGGFHAIKLRKNVPVSQRLLCLLTGKELATPLQIIGQAGVGLNHIDINTAHALNIEVINTPGSNAAAVAEFTLLQMLALLRQTDWHQRQLRQGRWTKNKRPPSRSLREMTIGLVGSGAISQALLALLKPFEPQVSILGSQRFTTEHAAALSVRRASNIHELVSSNDMISLHLPLTAETRYLINSSLLPYFRQGAYLLNTARGDLIDEHALALFMRQHPEWIAGVALDTFENETEPFSSPIQVFDEALLTPHIAGTTSSALLNAALSVQQDILNRLALTPVKREGDILV